MKKNRKKKIKPFWSIVFYNIHARGQIKIEPVLLYEDWKSNIELGDLFS